MQPAYYIPHIGHFVKDNYKVIKFFNPINLGSFKKSQKSPGSFDLQEFPSPDTTKTHPRYNKETTTPETTSTNGDYVNYTIPLCINELQENPQITQEKEIIRSDKDSMGGRGCFDGLRNESDPPGGRTIKFQNT